MDIKRLHLSLSPTPPLLRLGPRNDDGNENVAKQNGLMSKTIAVHVRYKSLYICLPSSAKQQREMTKFCVVYGTWTTTANFLYFRLEFQAVVPNLASASF